VVFLFCPRSTGNGRWKIQIGHWKIRLFRGTLEDPLRRSVKANYAWTLEDALARSVNWDTGRSDTYARQAQESLAEMPIWTHTGNGVWGTLRKNPTDTPSHPIMVALSTQVAGEARGRSSYARIQERLGQGGRVSRTHLTTWYVTRPRLPACCIPARRGKATAISTWGSRALNPLAPLPRTDSGETRLTARVRIPMPRSTG